MPERTTQTVALLKATIERLKDLGRKGDTYDDIVQRLLNTYETIAEKQLKKEAV